MGVTHSTVGGRDGVALAMVVCLGGLTGVGYVLIGALLDEISPSEIVASRFIIGGQLKKDHVSEGVGT